MSSAVDIQRLLPEVAAIGRTKLQDYCQQWLQRPIARQYAFTHLIVGSDLVLTMNIDDKRATYVNGCIFIPIDELVGYIIDQHFADNEQRRQLHGRVRELRKRWGDVGYEYQVRLRGKIAVHATWSETCGYSQQPATAGP